MSIRTERVARMIQKEVAALLQVEFYEASQSIITVTGARVTPDLSIAYIYLSVLGEENERRRSFKRMEDNASAIRKALASRIRNQVRIIPELRFHLDESQITAMHLEGMISEIREEREARGALDETPVDESLYMRNKKEIE